MKEDLIVSHCLLSYLGVSGGWSPLFFTSVLVSLVVVPPGVETFWVSLVVLVSLQPEKPPTVTQAAATRNDVINFFIMFSHRILEVHFQDSGPLPNRRPLALLMCLGHGNWYARG